MIQLKYDFFSRDTALVARELLGKLMIFDSPEGSLSGIVVEAEAYLGWGDPGSHSFRGRTKRNSVMFGPAGVSYIYLIYGMYCCYNVTTDTEDVPAAVLIRALLPLDGIETMKKNRQKDSIKDLCSGPGKLTKAFGIDTSLNGTSAVNGPVRFYEYSGLGAFKIHETVRVGLSQGAESLLRYYIMNNEFISRK